MWISNRGITTHIPNSPTNVPAANSAIIEAFLRVLINNSLQSVCYKQIAKMLIFCYGGIGDVIALVGDVGGLTGNTRIKSSR